MHLVLGAALLIVFFVLDLARPYVGPSLRPAQWVVGAILLATLCFFYRDWARAERYGIVALCALLLPTFIDHGRLVESDGIHYFSYLRSIVMDGDLDCTNDYALLRYSPPGPNVLPIGAPLLWIPFFLIAHTGRILVGLPLGWSAPTGAEPLYQAAVAFATLVYASAGLLLLWQTLRRAFVPTLAFATTILLWWGSPLRFYLRVLPSFAHGCEFFAAVLVWVTSLHLRTEPTMKRGWPVGLAAGLLFLVRSQDGLLLLLPLGFLLPQLIRADHRRASFRALGGLFLGFVLIALPQLIAWQLQFGTPLLVPHQRLHGSHFWERQDPAWGGVLFSDRGGVFSTHPILLLALFGLFVLAVRSSPDRLFDRRYVAAALPPAVAMWCLNALVFDWYQVRRFTGLVPLLAPGLARALHPIAKIPAVLVFLALIILNYDWAVDTWRRFPGDPVPVSRALRETIDGPLRDGYTWMERKNPDLATRWLHRYSGVGDDAVIDFGSDSPFFRLPRVIRSVSSPDVEAGERGRWLTGRECHFYWSLVEPTDLQLEIRGRALETVRPQRLQVLWNQARVEEVLFTPEMRDYSFTVPSALTRSGTNVIVFQFERGPVFAQTRGYGPVEIRPAFLTRWAIKRPLSGF